MKKHRITISIFILFVFAIAVTVMAKEILYLGKDFFEGDSEIKTAIEEDTDEDLTNTLVIRLVETNNNNCNFINSLPSSVPGTNCVQYSHPKGGRMKIQQGGLNGVKTDWFIKTYVLNEEAAEYHVNWVELPQYKDKFDSGSELAPGDYKIIFYKDGCDPLEHEFEIASAEPLPSISTEVVSHRTSCTSENGEMNVIVGPITTEQQIKFGDHTYTVRIYEGAGTGGNIYSSTSVNPNNIYNFTAIPAGIYTASITNNSNGCSSGAVIFEIEDHTFPPQISLVNSQNGTTCEPPNGFIEISVSTPAPGLEPSNGYDIVWSNGATGTYLGEIREGTYSVTVTNRNTQCTTTESFSISESVTYPNVNAPSIVHPTSCVNYNSSVTFNLNNGETIAWYSGNIVDEANRITGDDLSKTGLAPGNYIVRVRNNLGCYTDYPLQINDMSVTPSLSIGNVTSNTSCAPATYNGSATATSTASGATFRWYSNGVIHNDNLISSSATASGLEGNRSYLVQVTDVNGCTNTASVTIPHQPAVVTPPSLNVTGVTHCGPNNTLGSNGNASIVNPQAGFTYIWSNGASGTSISDLSTGNYSVIAQNNLGCQSEPALFTIANERVFPEITISSQPNSACTSPYNGSLTAQVNGQPASNYTFTWYSGSTTSGPVLSSTQSATGLRGGEQYTVQVTNIETDCFSTQTITLSNSHDIPNAFTVTRTHLTNCAVLNGSASIDNPVSGLTYTWSNGATGTSISGLAAGTYTVYATNAVGCSTNPLSFDILDQRVPPQVTLTAFENTACVASAYNGRITTAVSGGSGNYSYEWFNGGTTSGTSIGSGPELAGLNGGLTYTVRVTDTERDCSTTRSIFVPNQPDRPATPSVAATGRTFCDTPNGSASITGPDPNLTYLWSTGEQGTNITGLEVGAYSVRAVNALGCESDPVNFTIGNDRVNPDISVTISDNHNCSGPFDGSVSAHVNGETSGYEFTWYEGTTTSGNLVTELTQLEGNRYYTVRARNTSTQCEATRTVFVPNNITLPAAPALDVVNRNSCVADNGSASISGVIPANTTFHWYNDVPELIHVGNDINGLAVGNYSVRAVNTLTRCESSSVPFTINFTPANPPVELVESLTDASCDNAFPSGELQVTATEPGIDLDNGFTYEWYQNNTLISGESSHTLSQRPAGTYRVVITDVNNGCSTTLIRTISPAAPDPVVLNVVVDQHLTNCSPNNGRLIANASDGRTANFVYHWFFGDRVNYNNNSKLTDETSVLENLDAGDYTVIAISTLTNCVSDPITVTINAPFNVEISNIEVTSCDEDEGSAIAEVLIDQVVQTDLSDYTFYWYQGRRPLGDPIPGASGPSVSGLTRGTYTIIVRNTVTDCTAETTFDLDDNSFIVTQMEVGAIPPDNCEGSNEGAKVFITQVDKGDGSPIEIYFDDDGNSTGLPWPAEYEVYWFEGTNIRYNGLGEFDHINPAGPGPFPFLETLPNGDFLPPGEYTAIMFDKTPGNSTANCPSFSRVATVTLPDPKAADVVNISPDDLCSTPNGEIEFTINGISPPGFTFQWYEGRQPIDATKILTGETSNTISGMPSGYYTLVYTDDGECEGIETYYIERIRIPIVANYQASHILDCDQNTTGSITVTSIDYGTNNLIDFTGFTFTWYDSDFNPISNGTDHEIIGLEEGNYYLEITNDATGCVSPLYTIPIQDNKVLPVFALSNIVPDEHCKETGGSGEITLTATTNNTTAASGYTLTMTGTLNATFTTDASSSIFTFAELRNGTYEFTLTDNDTGCETSSSFTIIDAPAPSFIVDFTVTPNEYCSGGNGSIAITEIMYNNILYEDNDFTGFVFEWFNHPYDPENSTPIAGETDPVLQGLTAGSYWVGVKNLDSECLSQVIQIEVADDIEPVVVALSDFSPHTNCNGIGTGSVVASASTINSNNTNYTFIWRDSNGDEIFRDENSAQSTATALLNGSYSLEIEDELTGCTTSTTFNIEHEPGGPFIGNFEVTPQTWCDPNGGITLQNVFEGASSISEGNAQWTNYDFEWFGPDDPGLPLPSTFITGANNETITNISSGTYFVRTINTLTGCASDFVEIDIPINLVSPTLTFSNVVPNENCSGDGTGTLTATAFTNGSTHNYSFRWIAPDQTEIPEDPSANTFPSFSISGNTATAVGLRGGEYIVEVTDLTIGCAPVPFTFTIRDDFDEIYISDFIINAQTFCSPENGRIEITEINEGGQSTGNLSNYVFEWYAEYDENNPSNNVVVSGLTENIYALLSTGVYYVKAISTITGCESAVIGIYVPENLLENTVSFSNPLSNTHCQGSGSGLGSGSVTATALTDGSGTYNYSFNWRDAQGNPVPSVTNGNSSTVSNLWSGEYFVEVTNNDTGCPVIEDSFIIEDRFSNMTVLNYHTEDQTFCTYNGEIIITRILDGNNTVMIPDSNYEFVWDNMSSNSHHVTGLGMGIYTTRVRNLTTGCISPPIDISVQERIEPTTIAFSNALPTLTCAYPGTGEVTVTASSTLNNSTFSFTWYDPSGDPLPATQVSNNGSSSRAFNLLEGIYTVEVINNLNGCPEVSGSFQIQDRSTTPVISAFLKDDQTTCYPNGNITITQMTENNQSVNISDYSFMWYEGDENFHNGIPVSNENGPSIHNLTAGRYYVIARNNATGCVSEGHVINIDDRTVLPILTFEVLSPQTMCFENALPSGALRVMADASGDNTRYQFVWHYGNGPLSAGTQIQGVGNTNVISNMPSGSYSVEVLDLTTGYSTIGSYFIPENLNVDFDILYEPNINCVNYNGRLEVIVNIGTIHDYDIEWYEGEFLPENRITQTAGINQEVLENLAPGIYHLSIYSHLSGCTTVLEIPVEDDPVPVPYLVLVSQADATNCTSPNGAATVSYEVDEDWMIEVDDNEVEIEWYDASTGASVGTGDHLNILAPGAYSVVLRNTTTGCESDPLPVQIGQQFKFPYFQVETKKSDCGRSNGEAFIRMVESDPIAAVHWVTPLGPAEGLHIEGYPEGEGYEVTVYLQNGCSATKYFEIQKDIYVNNGVTPNGDGVNDHMYIECIELYPTNNVKIFNRAGALVFETNNYNNDKNSFLGIGNRGLYMGSKKLPVGTYFYVVDKNDGHPKAGYIELRY